MAQWVKNLSLDISSGHGLTIYELELQLGLCADSVEPAWDSLSPSLPLPCLFSFSQNKQINFKKSIDSLMGFSYIKLFSFLLLLLKFSLLLLFAILITVCVGVDLLGLIL